MFPRHTIERDFPWRSDARGRDAFQQLQAGFHLAHKRDALSHRLGLSGSYRDRSYLIYRPVPPRRRPVRLRKRAPLP